METIAMRLEAYAACVGALAYYSSGQWDGGEAARAALRKGLGEPTPPEVG